MKYIIFGSRFGCFMIELADKVFARNFWQKSSSQTSVRFWNCGPEFLKNFFRNERSSTEINVFQSWFKHWLSNVELLIPSNILSSIFFYLSGKVFWFFNPGYLLLNAAIARSDSSIILFRGRRVSLLKGYCYCFYKSRALSGFLEVLFAASICF